jgi:hypothetical protein
LITLSVSIVENIGKRIPQGSTSPDDSFIDPSLSLPSTLFLAWIQSALPKETTITDKAKSVLQCIVEAIMAKMMENFVYASRLAKRSEVTVQGTSNLDLISMRLD